MKAGKVGVVLTRMLAGRIVRLTRLTPAKASEAHFLRSEVAALREALATMGLLDEDALKAAVAVTDGSWSGGRAVSA